MHGLNVSLDSSHLAGPVPNTGELTATTEELSSEVKELLDCDVKWNNVTDEPKIRIRVPRGRDERQ